MMSQKSLLTRPWPVIVQEAGVHRKPRWLPVAKSKIYRIPKRPVVPEDEKLEMQRLFNNYRTQMRAIRRFYHEDMVKELNTLNSATSEMSQQVEAEDWTRCVNLNEQWNARVAAERETRRAGELAALREHARARIEEQDRMLQERIARASEQIKKQKELSKTFITLDTLDEAIDQAMANPVDYNFAIDQQGNKLGVNEVHLAAEKDRADSASV